MCRNFEVTVIEQIAGAGQHLAVATAVMSVTEMHCVCVCVSARVRVCLRGCIRCAESAPRAGHVRVVLDHYDGAGVRHEGVPNGDLCGELA